MKRSPLGLVTSILVLGCNYGSAPVGGETDRCGHVKTVEREIVNGVESPDPSVVELTEGQVLAVGALNLDFRGTCTATLVRPDVVLTAAHCVESLDGPPTFLVGDSYLPPETTLRGVEVHVHPEYSGSSGGLVDPAYDLAVILVEGDTEEAGLTPIPVNLETTSLLSETIQAVGYGTTDPEGDGWNTSRWWTTQRVRSETATVYSVSDDGESGLCYGDSGGPLMWTAEDGEVRVMGVASAVDSDDCLGSSLYARTDAAAEWLSGFVDPGPCGDETFEGRCDGDMAVWCADGEIYYHVCSDFGHICGRTSEGRYRCIPPDPCEGVDHAGFCDGNVAVWCEGEELWYHYCDDFGHHCAEGPDGLFRCLDECTYLGHEGACDGDTARWCDRGALRERDCAACDQECGWAGDALGHYCL